MCPAACKEGQPFDAPTKGYNDCDFMADRVAYNDCVENYLAWGLGPGYTSETCIADVPVYLQPAEGGNCAAVTNGYGAAPTDCYQSIEALGSTATCEASSISVGAFPAPSASYEALPGFGFCRMAGGNKSSTSDSFCIDSKDAAVVTAECEAKCDEVGCGCFAVSTNDPGLSLDYEGTNCPMSRCAMALDKGAYTKASWGDKNLQLRGYKAIRHEVKEIKVPNPGRYTYKNGGLWKL